MRQRGRVLVGGLSAATLLAVLAADAPLAPAASRRITGRLSEPGYTVIALAASGKARSVRARHGRFRLRPPAEVVTLHLRAENGTYAGPVVVDTEGKRAILGLRPGAELGRIDVRNGYARVLRALPNEWIDEGRWARARRGVPIGGPERVCRATTPPRSFRGSWSP